MAWTNEEKLAYLMQLPWTIDREETPEGDHVLRVRELPGTSATGATPEARGEDLWASLESTLRCYLHFGDPIPKPAHVRAFPWDESRLSGSIPRIAAVGSELHVVPQSREKTGVPLPAAEKEESTPELAFA